MGKSGETIKRTQHPGNLVWLDLEMTGLDDEKDAVLQAALIITNKELEPLEEFCCDVWAPADKLERMTPYVRQMHTTNGLLERVAQSKISIYDAEKNLLERVTGWCPYPATLCGNTIWTDRKFVDRTMPGLSRYLNYRLLDVSSLKILAKAWYGEAAIFTKSKVGEHDALVDIRNSIAELRHYRQTIFHNP